jgi:hypothetical protein
LSWRWLANRKMREPAGPPEGRIPKFASQATRDWLVSCSWRLCLYAKAAVIPIIMFSITHTARANETYRLPDNPTLSDFPLLIGEVIGRANLRDTRRRRSSSFVRIGKSRQKH